MIEVVVHEIERGRKRNSTSKHSRNRYGEFGFFHYDVVLCKGREELLKVLSFHVFNLTFHNVCFNSCCFVSIVN